MKSRLTGEKDEDYNYLQSLSDRNLFKICRDDLLAKGFCRDEDFWRDRTLKRLDNAEATNGKWKDLYLEIVSSEDELGKDEAGVNASLSSALRKNNLDAARYFIRKGADPSTFLKRAILEDNHIQTKFLLANGADVFVLKDDLKRANMAANLALPSAEYVGGYPDSSGRISPRI